MSKSIITGYVVSEQGNASDRVRKVEVKLSFKSSSLHIGDEVTCELLDYDD